MARLTILQASQQGFGSTLTIHRLIKDGLLPIYEDGDTKLIDVDDLISVLGEPKHSQAPEAAPAAPSGRVDIHEYNRLKAELDQKNKKNMWLAADLAEVVRELKEKEAKFEKERNRLLTVLEQAQALLLREEERIGPAKTATSAKAPVEKTPSGVENKPADIPMPTPEDSTPWTETGASPDAAPKTAAVKSNTVKSNTVKSDTVKSGAHNLSGIETLKDNTANAEKDAPIAPATSKKLTPEQELLFAPFPEASDANAPDDASEKMAEIESTNPLMPPLPEPNAKPESSRALGTFSWLLLFALAGGGFVFFEYRTKVISSVSKVLQAFS